MKLSLAFSVILLLPVFGAPQIIQKSSPSNQDLPADQKSIVMKLANLQKSFGPQMISPGVDLSLKEIKRWKASDRTLVEYELYTTGLPKTPPYSLLRVQISGKILTQLEGVTIASDGRAICAGQKGTCSGSAPNSPIDLVFFAGKSEPMRLSLVSNDDGLRKLWGKGSCRFESGARRFIFRSCSSKCSGKNLRTTTWSVKGKDCNPTPTFSWGSDQLE